MVGKYVRSIIIFLFIVGLGILIFTWEWLPYIAYVLVAGRFVLEYIKVEFTEEQKEEE